MEAKEIKIRLLTRKDRVALSGMVKKLAEQIGDTKLLNAFSGAGDGHQADEAKQSEAYTKAGMEVIKLLITTLDGDISDWFASLLGITREQYDEMPFDVEVRILQQLKEAPEFAGFFSGALQLFKGIGSLKGMLQGMKGK